MEKGKVYRTSDVIFLSKNGRIFGDGIRFSNKYFATNNNWNVGNEEPYLASPEEDIWLRECIKIGRYIKPDLLPQEPNYEIY